MRLPLLVLFFAACDPGQVQPPPPTVPTPAADDAGPSTMAKLTTAPTPPATCPPDAVRACGLCLLPPPVVPAHLRASNRWIRARAILPGAGGPQVAFAMQHPGPRIAIWIEPPPAKPRTLLPLQSTDEAVACAAAAASGRR